MSTVAIGKLERQVRKASHWQQATVETCHDHSYRLFAPHICGCYSSRTSRSWWITHITRTPNEEVVTTSPSFYNEPHGSHVLFAKAAPDTTFTSWSQHHFIAIGKSEWQVRKALHCGSKQQQGSHAMITLLLLVRATYMWMLFFAHNPSVVNRILNATPTELG